VLAVLCNGVSFGAKEPYLMPMNGLIKEYRPKLRHFLHSISSNANASPTPDNGPGNISTSDGISDDDSDDDDDDGDSLSDSDSDDSDDDSFTIDELASQFQVVSVGAKIATKEEQRKSRMSLMHSHMPMGLLPPTPDARQTNIPPLPPLPPLPSDVSGKGERAPRIVRQASAEAAASMRPQAAGVQPSRITIDIPPHTSSSSSAAVAVSSSVFDSLLDNEIVDESLVTIDFLICLEGNFSKLEAYVHGPLRSNQTLHQQMTDACRELKPIVHYAKRLSSPGRMPDTVVLSQPNSKTSQESARRFVPQFGRQRSAERRLSEEYEDLGLRRKSKMPDPR
ncbi:hypothetical protein GGH99_006955, partial [Coemansia sp. RSA 1285]